MLTIEGLIAVLSFGATMFGLGFAMGSYDNQKIRSKKPPLTLQRIFRKNP